MHILAYLLKKITKIFKGTLKYLGMVISVALIAIGRHSSIALLIAINGWAGRPFKVGSLKCVYSIPYAMPLHSLM